MANASGHSFGTLLRQNRRALGLTQEGLAERAGLSVREISNLERGARHAPRKDTVELLSGALDLDDHARAAFAAAAGRVGKSVEPLPTGAAEPLVIGGLLGTIPTTRLVARDAEMARVREVIQQVLDGAGRLMLLTGEPGSGRTRLAQEAALTLRGAGALVVTGSCYEAYQSVPYSPFLDVLTGLLHVAPGSIRDRLADRWPYLARLLPESADTAVLTRAESREDQLRLHRAVTGFVAAIAAHQPVAILLDDLQRADGASLDLFSHIARETRGCPVFLLATISDERRRHTSLRHVLTDMHRAGIVEIVNIGPLSLDGTAVMMRQALGDRPLPAELIDLVHRHTDGNPFFIKEVTRSLAERGVIVWEGNQWVIRRDGDLVIPDTVRETVTERLGHLSPVTQVILEEISVLGQTFQFDSILGMAEQGDDALEEALEEALEAGILREIDNDHYAFVHTLTQRVLYSRIGGRRRRRLHLAAGTALERLPGEPRQPAEVSRHFVAGGALDRALPFALLAGERAERVFVYDEAERQYRLAVDLAEQIGSARDAARARVQLARALRIQARYDEALAVLLDGKRASREPDMLARLEAEAALVRLNQGGARDAIDDLRDVLNRHEESLSPRSLAAVNEALSYLLFLVGKYSASLGAAEQAVAAARLENDQQAILRGELRRGTALIAVANRSEGAMVLQSVLQMAEAIGDLDTLTHALTLAGALNLAAGNFPQAQALMEQAVAAAERLHDPSQVSHALGWLGFLQTLQGHWTAARDVVERGVDIARKLTHSHYAAFPLIAAGYLDVLEGNDERGVERLIEAVGEAEKRNDPYARFLSHGLLAEQELLSGQTQAAVGRIEHLLERYGSSGQEATLILPLAAKAHLDLGQPDKAAALLTAGIEQAVAQGYRLALVDLHTVSGLLHLARSDPPRAQHHLEEALSLARTMPWPHRQARVLLLLAQIDQHAGRPEDAQGRLAEAMGIFVRLGAVADMQRVRLALERGA